MKAIFMGTPDFAVPALKKLIESKIDVLAVFTQPDKPKGRGHKLLPPPVKVCAEENGIRVYQPAKLKDLETYKILSDLKPDIIIVAAYGKILPKEILELPPMGCVNIHASLLPKYRGAGPIQWSILNGETETGVTTMQMAEGLDTGDILLMKKTPIGENETAKELHDRLSILGAELLIETLDGIENGTVTPGKQDDSKASYAPMLTKELCALDFSLPATEVHNRIRGLSEWPCATAYALGEKLKIYGSRVVLGDFGPPGTVLNDKKRFIVACGQDGVELLTVQYGSSKRMSGRDFLNGRNVSKLD